MKELNELLKMREEWLKEYEDEKEYYELFKSYNFVAYNFEKNSVKCSKDFASAKSYAEDGGQVLVLNTNKIYTYKVKNIEEYLNYLKKEINSNTNSLMNRYGL